MLLIYMQKVTPRKTYTFKQVLGKILRFEIKITSKIEEFIAYSGVKFSYGEKSMGNEFFVKSHGLLDKQGISKQDIKIKKWDEIPCFFQVGMESHIPFDIFSASFYMLSRYEEYLPHVKNKNGGFPAEESLAFQNKFLQQPIVDLWAYRFKTILHKYFPKADFPTRKYNVQNILSVEQVYRYKEKGFLRNLAGGVTDFLKLRWRLVFKRLHTLLFFADDPYDVYDELLKFSKQYKINWSFMFQLSDYSVYNKNIGYNRLTYHSMIKSMGDYGAIGLLLGYEALFDGNVLKTEKIRWENIVHRDLENVLTNDHGLNFPELYNNYDNLEITHDYSMGFPNKIGFRAGTCTSFLYYDLKLERISPLTLHPTAFNSRSFKANSFFEIKKILERVQTYVKKVNGELVVVFKNRDFAEGESKQKYYQILEKMNDV